MSNGQATENKMGVMPVNKLLLTMGAPLMCSMLLQACYNVVDSIFVSRICEDALTAVSSAFPMQNLMIGVASGIGVGTNAMMSRYLGEKKQEDAERMAMNGIFLAACGYLIFLILGIFATRIFYQLQGAEKSVTDYGVAYLSIVLICSFGIFAQFIFERLLQGTGNAIYTMFTQMLGAIINLILDPILIFGFFGLPKMGIAGAAVATVIGQIAAGILAFVLNKRKNKEITLHFAGFRPDMRAVSAILKIGIPSVIMVAIGSIMSFSINTILYIVFSSTAVAVFGVYFKLQSFVFMPVFGINNAMIPIIGYNYGAGKPRRMQQTLKSSMILGEAILIFGMVVAQLFPRQLLLLFDASENMLGIGVPALRTITISFLAAAFCVISSSYFQALGFSVYSMIVSFIRQLIFLVPLVFLLSRTGRLELVWWAWPVAEVASVSVCMFFQRRINKQILKPMLKKSDQ